MFLSPKTSLRLAATILTLALLSANARASTPAELSTHIHRLQALTTACAADPKACTPDAIGPNDTVGDPKQPGGYTVSWNWLRDALTTAATANSGERLSAMRDSSAHLASILTDLNAPAASTDSATFAHARTTVTDTLAAPEFNASAEPISAWERVKARFWNTIARAFEGLDTASGKRPWLGPLLASLFFLAAAVGFVFFLRYQLAESRLRVKLDTSLNAVSGWARESTAWADLATERATAGDFREAVHCLYWASIVLLEGRRLWRHDPSRTPREYVRLLKPGSPQREHLRALTALFERLWYGLRETTEADYLAARADFLALQSNHHPGAPGPDSRTRVDAPISPEAA